MLDEREANPRAPKTGEMNQVMAFPENENISVELPPRVDILGVGVHALNMPLALALITERLRSRRKGYVCATDVNAIMAANRDGSFKQILNRSFLTTPDGMPTVWLGRLDGHDQMDRVYGPDLMLEVCRMSVEKGISHFLYGGDSGVAEQLKQTLCRRFPGIQITGTYTPPFRPLTERESNDVIRQISESRPDIIWVGLGAPKQERFMAEYIDRLETTLMFGVGAAFDFHTGRKKEAPRWMMRLGLQWAHRFWCEPRRLGKRYLVNNPRFLFALLRSRVRGGR